ncbi:hypothetical protein C8R43DRAFT_163779 [Mycena crocata]|nr:hypothetical protein C8R43DRAFT_163779 [Mycena crocata]
MYTHFNALQHGLSRDCHGGRSSLGLGRVVAMRFKLTAPGSCGSARKPRDRVKLSTPIKHQNLSMATRRRVGVSSATSEAARRQLIQPVPSWEKVWAVPDNAPAGSTLRVLRWTKTSKIQHFSDDEGGADEPLAPLPDEVEVVEGDDEDQDEPAVAAQLPDAAEAVAPEEEPISKPSSPKPQLSMGLQPPSDMIDSETQDLDESLKTMEANMAEGVGVGLDTEEGIMDMSALAPDGLGLEATHDLAQMDDNDELLGGPMQMDDSVDPFAEPIEP